LINGLLLQWIATISVVTVHEEFKINQLNNKNQKHQNCDNK